MGLRNEANDLYWLCEKISTMSLEHASPEPEMDYVADAFDELLEYILRHKDDENKVVGGLKFYMPEKGVAISIGLSLILEDRIDGET